MDVEMDNPTLQQIKAQVDIVAVVGDHVRLKRVGATQSYIGLCPFHNEKTPSFRVHRDRQFFKCFGCGKGGDVFTFLQDAGGIDFPTALRRLADRAGLPLIDRPLTPAELAEVNRRKQHAAELEDFRHGVVIVHRRRRDRLASEAAASEDDALGELLDRALCAPAREAVTIIERASPAAWWGAYDDLARRNRAALEAAARAGHEDRELAEQVTREVVRLLVLATREDRVGAAA
jgi:CHC2-type zinc finger protein